MEERNTSISALQIRFVDAEFLSLDLNITGFLYDPILLLLFFGLCFVLCIKKFFSEKESISFTAMPKGPIT